MVIVAQEIFQINVDKCRIDILKAVESCGCVNILTLPERLGMSENNVMEMIDKLTGEGEITCNDGICCANKESLLRFTEKLHKLRGE